jgi:hypothetical protein
MKNIFLTMLIILLISVSGNCQWYSKRYGVNDINKLSQEQLSEALTKAKIGERNGAIMSTASAIGIGVGIIEILATKNVGEGFGILIGVGLIAVSVPLEVTGLVIWGTYEQRVNSIKEVLKSTELKMGLVNYQRGNIYSGLQGSVLPCLSLTIRF